MSIQQDAYPLPKATGEKVAETERLDKQHELWRLVLGSITTAPLPSGVASVLDVGCGTGIWSCQFAETHPAAQVLGVDIFPPTAPQDGRSAPQNCTFVQANVEEDWDFAASQSFDFIFARMLVSGLKDWPRLFGRVYQHLRPGGMFEVSETVVSLRADDGTTAKESASMRWFDQLREYSSARGVDPDAPLTFTQALRKTGFNILQDRTIKLYFDPDSAASQLPNGAQVARDLTSAHRRVIENMGDKVFPSEAQRALAADALDDLAQNSGRRGYHLLFMVKVVQKPT